MPTTRLQQVRGGFPSEQVWKGPPSEDQVCGGQV